MDGSVELKLCRGTQYKHCVLFSAARVAIAWYRWALLRNVPVFIPSNVCPALANALCCPVLLPVSAEDGNAYPVHGLIVQLYGQHRHGFCRLSIDPLMTCWGGTDHGTSIVSFGYSKTIDIGYGGALLTNSYEIFKDMERFKDFRGIDKYDQLNAELDRMPENIAHRKKRYDLWMEKLPYWFNRLPEPRIPWRVVCRVGETEQRDYVLLRVLASGCHASTNYPPLPGCTDPSSVQWGKHVINFWLDDDPEKALQDFI